MKYRVEFQDGAFFCRNNASKWKFSLALTVKGLHFFSRALGTPWRCATESVTPVKLKFLLRTFDTIPIGQSILSQYMRQHSQSEPIVSLTGIVYTLFWDF